MGVGDSTTGVVGPQHWLCERLWAHMCDYYEGANAFGEAQQMMKKRGEYQKHAYRSPADPETGLSGALAWSLESQGDMLLRFAHVDLGKTKPSEVKAGVKKKLQKEVPEIYQASMGILRLMFGEEHEYFTAVKTKEAQIKELIFESYFEPE